MVPIMILLIILKMFYCNNYLYLLMYYIKVCLFTSKSVFLSRLQTLVVDFHL